MIASLLHAEVVASSCYRISLTIFNKMPDSVLVAGFTTPKSPLMMVTAPKIVNPLEVPVDNEIRTEMQLKMRETTPAQLHWEYTQMKRDARILQAQRAIINENHDVKIPLWRDRYMELSRLLFCVERVMKFIKESEGYQQECNVFLYFIVASYTNCLSSAVLVYPSPLEQD